MALVIEGLYDGREEGLGVLLVVRDGDAGGESAPVGVGSAERGGCLGGQFVEFARFNSVDNTRKNLLGEGVGVHSKALRCLANPFENLIERHRLKRAVTFLDSHTIHRIRNLFLA